MDKEFLEILVEKYLNGEATPKERKIVQAYLGRLTNERLDDLSQAELDEVKSSVYQRLSEKIDTPSVPLYRRTIFKIAAMVILIAGIGTLLILNRSSHDQAVAKKEVKTDVAPGHEGAILTLADGKQIVLDSTGNGIITQQGASKVVKQADALSYQSGANSQKEVVYNTMTTPNGRQYALVLADGSKAWLNAGSSITFPTAFAGKERKVQVTGEVYFEVARNPSMPFRVAVNDMIVEVLGTHFNINSYSDEGSIKATLLEGAVKVTKGVTTVKLTPGDQSVLKNDGSLSVEKDINTDEIMAWKDGFFRFGNADLPTILRQFARWYDVQIVYE
jgi:transmembrane sensor